MARLPLVYHPNPVLYQKAAPVTLFDQKLNQLLEDMYETMYAAEGIGLAAPQIGISQQIAVIDVSSERNQPFCIINPVILERQGEEWMSGGCLSVPGTFDKVPRATWVKVRAQNEKGDFFEMEGEDLLGHCLQHEIDHLNGRLYIDYLSPLKKLRHVKKMQKFLKSK